MKKRPYFRVIQNWSQGPDEQKAAAEHQERLENYLKFGQPWSNKELMSKAEMPEILPYEIEVKHMSTSTTTVSSGRFVITTTLCCNDDYVETPQDYQ